MVEYERQVKGDKVKNWIIFGLVVLLIILLYSNTLDSDTKNKFYWIVGLVIIIVVILYILNSRKKIDVYQVAKLIVSREYVYTGKRINAADLTADILDSNTWVFGFESAGNVISYKWDVREQNIISRIIKKIDEVKNESNDREIHKAIALKNIEREVQRKIANEEGFDIVDPDSPK